jgi:hypothetical protein
MIVSMVYGSYYATSKSTDVYKAKMTQSQRARGALQQMARQIRCSYMPQRRETTQDSDRAAHRAAPESPRNSSTLSPRQKVIWQRERKYFHSEPGAASGEILRLVTTNGASTESEKAHGLLEIAYRYDVGTATLFRQQRRFISAPGTSAQITDYEPFLTNVDGIELEFYDGQQWLSRWDFARAKRLPRAVRINITVQDENNRQLQCGTTAHVACWRVQNDNRVCEESTSVTNK